MVANGDVKVTLYWLEKSRSQRTLWLLEECKLNYEVKTFSRQNQFAPPELKEIHPLGKSPVITIEVPGQERPLVVAESAFITEYLTDHFAPHLKPTQWQAAKEGTVGGETEAWMRYRYLMHYAEGTLMPFLVMTIIVRNVRQAPVPFFLRPITNQVAKGIESFVMPNIDNNISMLEEYLATSPEGGKYLCGTKLTSVDILLSFPVLALKYKKKLDTHKFPRLVQYANMLEKEPGYIAAVEKIEKINGKKYELM